ncbi:hypothetical protein SOVF_194670 [Spinacia oleracea]|nr:hypothetical protein SOVF_194670 [Spinacia oleracea]
MRRRVRRKVAKKGKENLLLPSYLEPILDENGANFSHLILPICPSSNLFLLTTFRGVAVDWTTLPDDSVIQLFALLNYRDRASLSSSCRTWQ